ncbi:MAG: hypothetical protein HY763_08630 [Planctomycetes bacterium]|nr:hypothetical protein [Planctomycetota bacterium]
MVRVNLIPDSLVISLARGRRLRRWSTAVGTAMLAALFGLGLDWWRSAEAAALRRQEAQLAEELAGVRTELRTVTTEAELALSQLQRADALRAKRAWSDLLLLVGACLPETSWLTSVGTDPARPAGVQNRPATVAPPTPAAGTAAAQAKTDKQAVTIEAPRKLRLLGYAAQPGEPHAFVTQLKAAEVFTNVTLVGTQREPVRDGSYYRFDVVCEW